MSQLSLKKWHPQKYLGVKKGLLKMLWLGSWPEKVLQGSTSILCPNSKQKNFPTITWFYGRTLRGRENVIPRKSCFSFPLSESFSKTHISFNDVLRAFPLNEVLRSEGPQNYVEQVPEFQRKYAENIVIWFGIWICFTWSVLWNFIITYTNSLFDKKLDD